MNKLITFVLALLSIAVSYLYYQQSKTQVIAYVDSAKMLNGYQAMIDGRKAYQKKAQLWQNNVDTLSSGFQRTIKAYERKSAGMSATEKQLARQLLGVKQKQFSDYQRAVQGNAKQEETQYNTKIISSVNAFLARYGKEHRYDIILIASPTGTIAYARTGLDITEDVVTALNKEYVKDAQ